MSLNDFSHSNDRPSIEEDIFKDRRISADRRIAADRRRGWGPGGNRPSRRQSRDRRRDNRMQKFSSWWLQTSYTAR